MTKKYSSITSWTVWSLLAILLFGCGEGSSQTVTESETSTTIEPETSTTIESSKGLLIDTAPLANVTYTCAGKTATTSEQGEFSCTEFPVLFSIGNIEIGKITSSPNEDAAVFSQNLLALPTLAMRHPDVIRLSAFLNAIDDDSEPSNGIGIDPQCADIINNIVTQKTSFIQLSDENLEHIVSEIQNQILNASASNILTSADHNEITKNLSLAATKQYTID